METPWENPKAQHQTLTLTLLPAGSEALVYFQDHNPGAEPMSEGSNEAEWIVDLTTHADRDEM